MAGPVFLKQFGPFLKSWAASLIGRRPNSGSNSSLGFRISSHLLHPCRNVSLISPRQMLEAEVEDAIEFVEGDAHVETGASGDETIAAGLLHNRQAIQVKPTDRARIEALHDHIFRGLEPATNRRDAALDKILPRALHRVVVRVIRRRQNFFRHAERRANFRARKFPILQELQIAAGKGRSEEHTSELQSHSFISYAVFCLKK